MSPPETFSLLAAALAFCAATMGAFGSIANTRNVIRAAWFLGALALTHALVASWWVALA